MRKVDYVASIILLVLGVIHTGLTPVLAEAVNSPPVEFVAIGVMFILIGLFNIARLKTDEKTVQKLCLIGNLSGLGWLCFSFVFSIMHGESFSQGILPLVCLIIALFMTLYNLKNKKTI